MILVNGSTKLMAQEFIFCIVKSSRIFKHTWYKRNGLLVHVIIARLDGYPADFKFTKKKANNGSRSVVNNASVIDSVNGNELTSNSSCPQAHVFAQARYHQILSLLNKEPTVEATASLAGGAQGVLSAQIILWHEASF
ncbi:uncharacterized protein [Gossypium hirsutum]|uniref:Uncharacterized protein isoform X6 n=1 Tax=Gossypium hirsutum TaxID=3635 RepID=A0A1U8IC25_GOSHI|nr:uncharacterized protein LOC107895035 isoform X6 [Gossypium hirsutum]